MPAVLIGIVVLLFGVAISVQVFYLRGLKRAGVEVPKATVVISVVNIALLSLVALGLLAFILIRSLGGGM